MLGLAPNFSTGVDPIVTTAFGSVIIIGAGLFVGPEIEVEVYPCARRVH